MSKFIIFGGANYNTLGVIRCMTAQRIPFFLLLVSTSRFNMVLLSHGVTNYQIIKTEKDGIDFLLKNKEQNQNAVVFPTSDKAESLLDIYFDDLKEIYIFPHTSFAGGVNAIMDKCLQVQLAKQAGLNTPETIFYTRGTKLPVKSIIYPCIIKQANSTTGQKKILKICYNEMDLKSAIASNHHTQDFVIQRFINKDYELLLIGCRMPNGDIWIPGVFKKLRWYLNGGDASFGIISTKVTQYFQQLKEVQTFLCELGYVGPFSIEFGIENNTPFFYEINLRNDGTSHYFHKAGIFIPYIYYLASINRLQVSDYAIRPIEYKFIDEFGDIVNLRATDLSVLQWLKDLKQAKVYKYYLKQDVKPFLAIAPRRILSSIYKLLFYNTL